MLRGKSSYTSSHEEMDELDRKRTFLRKFFLPKLALQKDLWKLLLSASKEAEERRMN